MKTFAPLLVLLTTALSVSALATPQYNGAAVMVLRTVMSHHVD